MRRILVVGEATNERGRPSWRGEGSSYARLCRWLGYPDAESMVRDGVILTNVGETTPEGKFRYSDREVANVLRNAPSFDFVLLLGRRAQAIVETDRRGLTWTDGNFCGLPHPSGRNRLLNDGGDRRVAETVRRWMQR